MQDNLQKLLIDNRFAPLYTIRILFQTAKAPRKYRGVVAAFYKRVYWKQIGRRNEHGYGFGNIRQQGV